MNRKKAIKKILSHFNVKIPVNYSVYGYGLVVNTRENTFSHMMIQNPNEKGFQDDIDKAFSKHYKQTIDLPISEELFSILHEIGHIKADNMDFEEYSEDVETLTQLYTSNLISIEQYIQFYTEIEAEADANRWAIAWVKSNPELAKRFDRFMR